MPLAAVDRVLGSRPRWQVGIVTIVLAAVIGIADHLTGFELSFAVFYLLPIVLAAWHSGEIAGVAACALCSAIWLLVDYTAGGQYSEAWIPWWNAGSRFLFFAAIAWLLARLRKNIATQEGLLRKDLLTGVGSARGFHDDAERVFASARRHDRPLALGYLDMDGFKKLNDSRGHNEGDRALQRVGAELNRHIRASDVAARIGGDEFAVLMSDVGHEAAAASFARLHGHLQAAMREGGWEVGFSIGVATFDKAGPSVREALLAADTLMYEAKTTRSNTLVCRQFPALPEGQPVSS